MLSENHHYSIPSSPRKRLGPANTFSCISAESRSINADADSADPNANPELEMVAEIRGV
jgi:hypothetical protein